MPKQRNRTIAILLGLSAVVIAGVYLLATPNRPHLKYARAKNVIIISLDTLRADRLGAYGYNRETSPALDRFASDGIVFEKSVSPAPWTLPTHVSLLSGLFPTTHGVTKSIHQRIPNAIPLLAEVLRETGFRTHAVTGGGYLSENYGFNRGFETFEKHRRDHEGTTSKMLKRAEELITTYRASGEQFFVFLHTYDIHCPYAPPEPYFSMFKSDDAEYVDTDRCAKYYIKNPVNEAQAKFISDRYDGSIRWVDDKLNGFFEFLRSSQVLNDTLVVIMSDHGEEFLERGTIGHSGSLHKELLDVPLIITGSGLAPRRISTPVSLVDVKPTLLALLGVSYQGSKPSDGRSLVAHILGEIDSNIRPFQFAELDREKVLRTRVDTTSQLILDIEEESYKYVDLATDHIESGAINNMSSQKFSDQYLALQEFLSSLGVSPKEEVVEESGDQLNQLRTLGYL